MGMILWAGVAGALIGWMADRYGEGGFFAGALLGALMGAWLRNVIRAEIADAIHAARDRFEPQIPTAMPAATPVERGVTPPPAPREAVLHAQPLVAPEPQKPEPVLAPPEPTHTPAYPANPAEELFDKARDWLLGGNTIVRVGLVVLFLGLVFLARFVAMSGLFPIEARLATIAAAGVALLVIGWRKRLERPDFGLSLQGAGVAVLYLVVFAAAPRAYDVLPLGAGFALMILFASLGCALAVMQDSLALALAAFLGGFAVPVLLGGHADTPLGLFAYITILNLAVLFIAWRKSWRALNLLGFAATFLLATAWGFSGYEERHYLVCQIFLIASMAIYLAMAVLYAHATPGKLGAYADSTLLFGTALAGFGHQAALVRPMHYGAAWSALGFGAAYLALGAITLRKNRAEMRFLNECLLAIGAGFVTLAIPLTFDVKATASLWALEGAGAVWVGARQARWLTRAAGLALQAAAAVMALGGLGGNVAVLPFVNNGFLLPMLVAGPVIFAAWLMRHDLPHSGSMLADTYTQTERALAKPWFLGGFLFVCIAILREAGRRLPVAGDYSEPALPYDLQTYAGALGMLAAMVLADLFGKARDWAVARWPARAALVLVAFLLPATLIDGRHVLYWPDIACWAAALGAHLWLLRRQGESGWTYACHVGTVLLALCLAGDMVWLGVDRAHLWDSSWAGVAFVALPAAMLAGLTLWRGREGAWPLTPYAPAYRWHAGLVVAGLAYAGTLALALLAKGVTPPMPYIPLLNPVDLCAASAIGTMALWRRRLDGVESTWARALSGRFGLGALAVLGFILLNTIWLRSAHHWLGLAWDADVLGHSQIVQSGYSLLWTTIAMALMFLARARAERLPWLTGAGLLAVVVAKLVLVDMSHVEGLARIVAFIGVGVLMLLIGYFVPLPPRRQDDAHQDETLSSP